MCYSLWYNAPTMLPATGVEIYLLIKYIKSVLWRVAKRLSYIQDARCLKVKALFFEITWVQTSRIVLIRLNLCLIKTICISRF